LAVGAERPREILGSGVARGGEEPFQLGVDARLRLEWKSGAAGEKNGVYCGKVSHTPAAVALQVDDEFGAFGCFGGGDERNGHLVGVSHVRRVADVVDVEQCGLEGADGQDHCIRQ